MDTMKVMMFSNFLVYNSRATDKRYIAVSKMTLNHQAVLRLLVKLCKDVPVAKTLDITQYDDLSLYISSDEDTLPLIQAVDVITRSDQNPAPSTQIILIDTPGPSLMSFRFST